MKRVRAMCWPAALAAVFISSGALSGGRLHAEALPEVQQKIEAASQELQKAAELYRTKKFEEFGKVIDGVQKTIEDLKSGDDKDAAAPMLSNLEMRMEAAHRLLRSTLDTPAAAPKKTLAKTPARAMPKPTAMANKPLPGRPVPGKPAAMAAGGVSFTNQIAPLLNNKCGRCHTNNPKGGFSVASYADIRRGSDGGIVFTPGAGVGSRLVDLLETGEMPKGGGKLSTDEIDLVIKWINAGGQFDGVDPTAMASAGPNENYTPTGRETVSFMRDIAPVIVGNCVSCHGGTQGADNLELETWNQIKRGGRDGDLLSAGNPGNSLLVKMLKGTAKDQQNNTRRRMPDRRPALKDEIIKKIETWISEGAKFDGDDPAASLDFLLRVITAGKATHEELAKMREDLAKRNWELGNPGLPQQTFEEPTFRLIGDLSPARMEEVVKTAKAVQAKVEAAMRVTPGKPMYKGKLTIFVFNKRFEYSEFGQMVEKREIDSNTHGHFRYNVIDGYACILPGSDDLNLPLLLAEAFTGSYIETLAKNVPRWFAVGSGKAMAARMEARGPLGKFWEEQAAMAMSSAKSGNFYTAKELDSDGAALSFALVRDMMGRGSNHHAMLDMMKKGASFKDALGRNFPDVLNATSK